MKKLSAILALALALALPMAAQSPPVQFGTTPLQQSTAVPYQIGGAWVFNASSGSTAAFPIKGVSFYLITFVPSGTVSSCALSMDSASAVDNLSGAPVSPVTGGILPSSTIGSCAAAGEYLNATAAGISNFGILTPTITGTGTVTVTIFGYLTNPAATSGSAASIASPVDGSGYVEVNCKTGCSATALGQTTMSASLPVAIASNQSTLNVAGTFWQATQPVSLATAPTTPVTGTFWQSLQPVNTTTWAGSTLGAMANYGTSPGAVLVPGVNANVTNTVGVTGSVSQTGTWNVRITGNGGAVFDTSAGATAAVNSVQIGGVYNSSAPSPSTGQQEPLQIDSAANLKVNCITGCSGGSGGGPDEGTFTFGTSNYSPIGGTYNSSVTNLTSGQGGAVQLTNDRTLMVTARMQSYTGSAWANAVNWGADTSAFTAGTTPTIPIGGVYGSPANCTSGDQCAAQLTVDRKLYVQDFQGTSPWVTQPAALSTLIGFQQSVTASAIALSSNSSHSFCVAALPANTINIYVGPSGVTTSTGFPLQPGQSGCWTLSNTNLMYVIASTTGASVAVTGS